MGLYYSSMMRGFMYNQLYPYVNEMFSKLHSGFCKGYNAEQCLIYLSLKNGGKP